MLAVPWNSGRLLVFLPYVYVSFPPFLNFSFLLNLPISLLLLKSSRSSVLLIPTPFTSVISPSMTLEENYLFSRYHQLN